MAKPKNSAKGKSEFQRFAERPPELTVLTDHPLDASDAGRDSFELRYRVGPLYNIIRHPDTKMPMTIAIYGDWGTGKTSAMRWLEGALQIWNAKRGTKNVKVRPVWFYPWKYDNKEDVWRGLIAEVILNAMTQKPDTHAAVETLKMAATFVGKSAVDLASGVELSLGPFKMSGKPLKDVRDNLKDAVYPEKPYLQEYEATLREWVKKSLGANHRMVVFIDDLDRCMPEIALQVLEALKLYLNIPKLIFVVGVDKNVVERLVVEHYTKLGLVQRKGEKDTDADHQRRRKDEAKARQYLSKMFQVEVELAPSQEQVRGFFAEQLEGIPYWKENLKKKAHQTLFRNVVLELAGRNPREVKRLLNSALMAGAGTEMMQVEEGMPALQFEQGLQDYFVRTILQRRYPSLADMIATDIGREFFVDWSHLVTEQQKEKPSTSGMLVVNKKGKRGLVPGEEENAATQEKVARELGKKPQYGEYLRLTTDDLLATLMQIPFSAELAERTRHSTEQREVPPARAVSAAKPESPKASPSKDRTIIRETMARALGKSPSDLTTADDQEITTLDLSLSQVSDIEPIKALTNLQTLDLAGTQVSNLKPIKALTNLQNLSLANTQVSDIEPLRVLTDLRTLDLGGTQVSNVEPIKALANLQFLYLTGTQVSNLEPIKALTNLQYLSLSNTQISDIEPIKALTNLQQLWLNDTHVSDVQVNALRKALPKLEIPH